MSVDIEKAKELKEMISKEYKKRATIVLNPDDKSIDEKSLDKEVIYDKARWNISEDLNSFVQELSTNDQLSTEDKILKIFEKICRDYTYDDNLISYIEKVDDDIFSVPEWYGQKTGEEWEKNRELHKRRVCFELSRYLTKALTELLKDNDDYNICIYWIEDLTHYITGLSCSDYSITLDTDDFFNIKDLTRIKAGLTAEGINILKDDNNKFKNALDKFNEGKYKQAIEKIDDEIKNINNKSLSEETQSAEESEDKMYIDYLQKSIICLSEDYHLDSQGLFEYLKEIIDIRFPCKREKIWKRIDGNDMESSRNIRCLVLVTGNSKILVDVDAKEVRYLEEKDISGEDPLFVANKELTPPSFYNGR